MSIPEKVIHLMTSMAPERDKTFNIPHFERGISRMHMDDENNNKMMMITTMTSTMK